MSILSQVDLSLALSQEEYVEQLTTYQIALSQLAYQVYVQKRPVAIVFEGWDAGGKGGAIKRLTERIDPRGYVVYPIAAPQGEDKTHHYLYRFWRRAPERGQIAVFDRSWYGRVMVERIEGFCSEAEWKRAYREINGFERQWVEYGVILFKFWIHIGRDEQLRRFEERAGTPYKAWKLTEEDWRNREKWSRYEESAEEMLLKTSTHTAPWTIIEGNDKWWARVKVMRTVAQGLAKELKVKPGILDIDLGKAEGKKGKKQKTREELLEAIEPPDLDEEKEEEEEGERSRAEAREEREDRDEKKHKKHKKDDR